MLPAASCVALHAQCWSAHRQWQRCAAHQKASERVQQSTFGWQLMILRQHSTSPVQTANTVFLACSDIEQGGKDVVQEMKEEDNQHQARQAWHG